MRAGDGFEGFGSKFGDVSEPFTLWILSVVS